MDRLSGRRIGILGGTFDPVHIGHLIMGAEAAASLRLDEVVFMPARFPPNKPDLVPAPVEDRLAMLELALDGQPGARISNIDVERPGPAYTVDTLRMAREVWELQDADRLWFVMGGDSLLDLPRWRSPAAILELARLAVVARPGFPADATPLEHRFPGILGRVDGVDAPVVGVSASDIRRRVAEGRPIRWHVPPAVERYIRQHGLYREGR
jgi:nicotinate-nucleotide adenylyltransferase